MSYFRRLNERVQALLGQLKKNDRWLILCVADPDALASAMALKRLLANRVQAVGLGMVNEISRPDNLAMVKYLRIPIQRVTPLMAAQYDKFALVDSQPHHSPAFADYTFSLVIDHHPESPEYPVNAVFSEIRPQYGANSTLMTEFLYNAGIKPGKLLATALLYGIKTDTQSFERNFHDADVKAFRYLSKYANHLLLRKIVRSEFRIEWLQYFSQAFRKMRVMGEGLTAYMGEVDSSDILVILADFFLRVHGISWTIVSGVNEGKLINVFRGDGLRRDMGKMAQQLFNDVGSAGGHKSMARAEVPMKNLGEHHPQQFIWERLENCKKSPKNSKSPSEQNDSGPEAPTTKVQRADKAPNTPSPSSKKPR
ncbi:MAG: DHH family phosphoesterase [Desulfohalobium sp.]